MHSCIHAAWYPHRIISCIRAGPSSRQRQDADAFRSTEVIDEPHPSVCRHGCKIVKNKHRETNARGYTSVLTEAMRGKSNHGLV